ncbi:hypothetical protein [Paenibacillus sp. WLX2291]|uniref:hypothetical protein n=1 Tax=Paenibacillus sp. WLX2291 TaxID=3296934 RepID=UPI0039843865
MIGNIKINLWFGIIGFAITFFASFGNNPWTTSLVRGCFGFALWFMLAFLLRFILGILASPAGAAKKPPSPAGTSGMPGTAEQAVQEDQDRGNRLDITSPDQDNELNNLLTPKPVDSGGQEGFSPLDPPKLVSTKQQDPEELAKAVRHLTQK